MTTDTKPFDLESLSLLSDEALDIEVAKMRGYRFVLENAFWYLYQNNIPLTLTLSAVYIDTEEEAWAYAHGSSKARYFSHPSTDARAALLLLEEAELIFEPFITPKGTNLTVWNKREWFEGKPSVALPRAITIAYILFKQSQ
jgi:hypothetical protein